MAASCPPWQMGPGGRCMTDLSCRGGVVEISRRGYPACYCPVGMVAWGDYPRLSCVPSIARIAPLLLGTVLGVDQGRPQFGQVYGNKRFCGPGQDRNAAELRGGAELPVAAGRHAAELHGVGAGRSGMPRRHDVSGWGQYR